jgi:hypothetical protein
LNLQKDLALVDTPVEMANCAEAWLLDEKILQHQSLLARRQIEKKFSFESTYAGFSAALSDGIRKR